MKGVLYLKCLFNNMEQSLAHRGRNMCSFKVVCVQCFVCKLYGSVNPYCFLMQMKMRSAARIEATLSAKGLRMR